MRNPGTLTLAFIAAFLAIIAPVFSLSAADCFRRSDSRNLDYAVFQVSPPPRFLPSIGDYLENSAAYPASDYTTTTLASIATVSPVSPSGFKFRKTYLPWTNRCMFLPGLTPNLEACRNTRATKGNGYLGMLHDPSGNQIRALFATYDQANTCTIIQIMRVFGDVTSDLAARGKAAGITVVWDSPDREGLRSLARPVALGKRGSLPYLVGVCVLPNQAEASDADGLVMDYEPFDFRTPAQTVAFVRELKNLTARQGKEFIFASNPLPRVPNGLDASNTDEILGIVDGFVLTPSTGASPGNPTTDVLVRSRKNTPMESLHQQMSIVTADGKYPLSATLRRKIILQVSLFDTQLAEASQLRQEIKSQGYRGVMIFRNFQKEGGACSRPENQLIACLALGHCDGNFGKDRMD